MIRAITDQSRLIRLPAHTVEKLAILKRLEREYENDLVLNPHACDQEIIERLGLSNKDVIKNKPGKGEVRLKRLRAADARHFSIDLDVFAELMVDEDSFEEQIELKLLSQAIQEWLQRFPEREREVVCMRTGLANGEEKTLEEIGRLYGLTRERIRQIEAKAYRRMSRPMSKYALNDVLPETDHRIQTAINDLRRPLFAALDALDSREVLRPTTVQKERHWVEQRIEKRIMRGRRRVTGKRGQSSRISLFAQILSESGQPLHYTEIHQRALALLPLQQQITKEIAYATLFYSDRFRPLGGGVFSLASWQNAIKQTSNGPVFAYCPPPLLPANAHPRAFLDSILVARQLVESQPKITVAQFYEEMLKKSRRDRSNPQDAFDAWYAAGLHEHIQFTQQAWETMKLSIPAEWKLAEVRVHCLNHLCRHILKMPELLAALDRLANVEIATLQKLLFGSVGAGFDVPSRLNMLAAFEAVRADGDMWRITEVGRAALQANPPQELPDLGAIETMERDVPEADDWDDHLAIFTL